MIPLVDIVTPNIPEAKIMTDSKNHERLCQKFFKLYHKPILLKGGHLKSKSRDFFYDGKTQKILSSKCQAKKIRGTGCILSTRLACHLANGETLGRACQSSKKFMNQVFSGKIKI
jgi:hydroxymethylpyrimidine/phosphomethylpyrimidine kinase